MSNNSITKHISSPKILTEQNTPKKSLNNAEEMIIKICHNEFNGNTPSLATVVDEIKALQPEHNQEDILNFAQICAFISLYACRNEGNPPESTRELHQFMNNLNKKPEDPQIKAFIGQLLTPNVEDMLVEITEPEVEEFTPYSSKNKQPVYNLNRIRSEWQSNKSQFFKKLK